MNLFAYAIRHNELLDFAMGKEAYFVVDRDTGGHSVIQSWITNVLPLISETGVDYVNDRIEDMFKELLECNLDIKIKNEILLNHLHVYYYLNSEGRILANDLMRINDRIITSLSQYICALSMSKDSREEAVAESIKRIKLRGGLRDS